MKKEDVLKILKNVEFGFSIHSDMSGFCNGYNALHRRIEIIETTGKDYFITDDKEIVDIETLKEWRRIGCNIAQLIQGWNATEAEWSEWDKQVYTELITMQKKLDELCNNEV